MNITFDNPFDKTDDILVTDEEQETIDRLAGERDEALTLARQAAAELAEANRSNQELEMWLAAVREMARVSESSRRRWRRWALWLGFGIALYQMNPLKLGTPRTAALIVFNLVTALALWWSVGGFLIKRLFGRGK